MSTSLPTGVYNETENETLRCKYSVCPHGIIEAERLLDGSLNGVSLLVWVDEESVEVVDFVAWRLALYLAMEEIANVFVVVHFVLNSDDGASDLPVGLTVELVCLDIGCA